MVVYDGPTYTTVRSHLRTAPSHIALSKLRVQHTCGDWIPEGVAGAPELWLLVFEANLPDI